MSEPILFKQPFVLQHGFLNYGCAIILLLIVILILAKKHKSGSAQQSACQLIDRKYLGNKSIVYVIEYQQQRFILADNQQALAIHPLIASAEKSHG